MSRRVIEQTAVRPNVTVGSKGFTLVEMIITLAVLGMLATAVFPMGKLAVQRHKERDLRHALQQIRTAIDAYKQAADEGKIVRSSDDSGYPKKLEVLVEGVDNVKDPKSGKIYFLRQIPRDPFADEVLPAVATWAKRSYASPPDQPAEGNDVFDIHSKSSSLGINGIPYKEW
jgi:general secretion pathway protein G